MQRRPITQKQKDSFIDALSQTGNITKSCVASGISRRVAYNFREKDKAFSEAWDDALETGTDALEAEAWRRATKGTERPVYQGGKLVGHIQEYSDVLLIFLLKGKRPKVYADLHRVEGGDKPVVIEVRKFSEDRPAK